MAESLLPVMHTETSNRYKLPKGGLRRVYDEFRTGIGEESQSASESYKRALAGVDYLGKVLAGDARNKKGKLIWSWFDRELAAKNTLRELDSYVKGNRAYLRVDEIEAIGRRVDELMSYVSFNKTLKAKKYLRNSLEKLREQSLVNIQNYVTPKTSMDIGMMPVYSAEKLKRENPSASGLWARISQAGRKIRTAVKESFGGLADGLVNYNLQPTSSVVSLGRKKRNFKAGLLAGLIGLSGCSPDNQYTSANMNKAQQTAASLWNADSATQNSITLASTQSNTLNTLSHTQSNNDGPNIDVYNLMQHVGSGFSFPMGILSVNKDNSLSAPMEIDFDSRNGMGTIDTLNEFRSFLGAFSEYKPSRQTNITFADMCKHVGVSPDSFEGIPVEDLDNFADLSLRLQETGVAPFRNSQGVLEVVAPLENLTAKKLGELK